MKQSNLIIITIVLSVILGASGFLGMRYYLEGAVEEKPGSGFAADGFSSNLPGNTGTLPGQTDGDTQPDMSPPQGGGAGNQQAIQPPADYPHPVVMSANAVIRNADDASHDYYIDISVTFHNNSPYVLRSVSGMLYALDSEYNIDTVIGEFCDELEDYPNKVQPGETVTYFDTYSLESWSSTLSYFNDNNVRIGILYYRCEEHSYHSVTGSFTGYDDLSTIFMVPVVISDQR